MLIAFAIFGISVAVGLVTLVLYLNPGLFGRYGTSIPGTTRCCYFCSDARVSLLTYSRHS